MPKLVKSQIVNRSNGESFDATATFEDAEWQTLLRFAEESNRLMQTRMISEGSSCNFSFKYNETTGIAVSATIPPEDDLAAFLHRMRPFVLQDEGTSFFRVCGILSRRFSGDAMHRVVDRQRSAFSGRDFRSEVTITSNQTVLNSDDVVMKWLNAYEYHRDHSKQAELAALHQVVPLEAGKAIFISMLMDKAAAVGEIAHLIRAMERGNNTTIIMRAARI